MQRGFLKLRCSELLSHQDTSFGQADLRALCTLADPLLRHAPLVCGVRNCLLEISLLHVFFQDCALEKAGRGVLLASLGPALGAGKRAALRITPDKP